MDQNSDSDSLTHQNFVTHNDNSIDPDQSAIEGIEYVDDDVVVYSRSDRIIDPNIDENDMPSVPVAKMPIYFRPVVLHFFKAIVPNINDILSVVETVEVEWPNMHTKHKNNNEGKKKKSEPTLDEYLEKYQKQKDNVQVLETNVFDAGNSPSEKDIKDMHKGRAMLSKLEGIIRNKLANNFNAQDHDKIQRVLSSTANRSDQSIYPTTFSSQQPNNNLLTETSLIYTDADNDIDSDSDLILDNPNSTPNNAPFKLTPEVPNSNQHSHLSVDDITPTQPNIESISEDISIVEKVLHTEKNALITLLKKKKTNRATSRLIKFCLNPERLTQEQMKHVYPRIITTIINYTAKLQNLFYKSSKGWVCTSDPNTPNDEDLLIENEDIISTLDEVNASIDQTENYTTLNVGSFKKKPISLITTETSNSLNVSMLTMESSVDNSTDSVDLIKKEFPSNSKKRKTNLKNFPSSTTMQDDIYGEHETLRPKKRKYIGSPNE